MAWNVLPLELPHECREIPGHELLPLRPDAGVDFPRRHILVVLGLEEVTREDRLPTRPWPYP
jgi:hypothetical protein